MISVETEHPESLAREIEQKFKVTVRLVDGALRIEQTRGHEFIPQLISAFPHQIRSVTLGKPTLEDVFIKHTGHRFWKTENQ